MKYKVTEYEERYYVGVEQEGGITLGNIPSLHNLWTTFLREDLKLLNKEDIYINKVIGLECYPPNLMETKVFDYYAMVQTKDILKQDGFVTKKLPKGKYMEFEVSFDNLHHDIQQVYKYIKENKINVHMGFDYEDYLENEEYFGDGAVLNFCVLLDE